jgi:hypothetical protein
VIERVPLRYVGGGECGRQHEGVVVEGVAKDPR